MKNKALFAILLHVMIFPSLIFGQALDEKIKKPTILFVCEHGAGRSAIASAYFNDVATKIGLKYDAIFRGIDPDKALGTFTKNGLVQDGVDITNMIPMHLTDIDISNAFKIITLDCTLPDPHNKETLSWTGIEMRGNYALSKNQIASKVDSLVITLPK